MGIVDTGIFIHAIVPRHVESCVLLERVSNRKTDAKVRIDVDLEDYYRIKAGKKNRIEE